MKYLNRICLTLTFCSLVVSLCVIFTGQGLIDGKFGPADNYYTDVPDRRERFYGNSSLMTENSSSLTLPFLILSLICAILLMIVLLRSAEDSK